MKAKSHQHGGGRSATAPSRDDAMTGVVDEGPSAPGRDGISCVANLEEECETEPPRPELTCRRLRTLIRNQKAACRHADLHMITLLANAPANCRHVRGM